jgi:ankyrin repeat protein
MIDAPCGLIEKLIDEKILDSKILDQRDNTLLHCAVFFNRSDIIPMLLQKGVYVNARNKLQETPLHWAVNLYSDNCVVDLLAHPDINTQARNWLNKKASFYVSNRKMFWEVYSSEQKNKMRLIRNILKQHNKARKNNHAQRSCGEKYKSLK